MRHGWFKRLCAAALVCLLVMGFSVSAAARELIPKTENNITFVWMSDTQHLSGSYPKTFLAMTQWIVDNRQKLNIKYVFHTGDIVHTGRAEKQWQNADAALSVLDGVVPYGVLPGNHDRFRTSPYYQKYFGAQRFAKNGVFRGSYQNNWGHYDIVQAGSDAYLMLYLGYGIDKQGIQWGNDVLQKYRAYTAFVCFHSYLGTNARYTGIGRTLYERLVKPNPNVAYVLSGHKHGTAYLRTDLSADGKGRVVYQMLSNYQGMLSGGNGRMRIMTLNPDAGTLSIRTFSPLMEVDAQPLTLPLK